MPKRTENPTGRRTGLSGASTLEELAACWDTHDLADVRELTKAVEADVRLMRRRYLVAIESDMLRDVRRLARRRKVSYGTRSTGYCAGDVRRDPHGLGLRPRGLSTLRLSCSPSTPSNGTERATFQSLSPSPAGPARSGAVEDWRGREAHEGAAHTIKCGELLLPMSGALYEQRLHRALRRRKVRGARFGPDSSGAGLRGSRPATAKPTPQQKE